MGMFDYYEPKPAISCSACGHTPPAWQGKDGPCGSFVWRQGFAAPVRQEADEDCRLKPEKLAAKRLPKRFVFYPAEVNCRHCPSYAIGETEGGVWTRVVEVHEPA